ncbi:MAG TPA: hypothetical protein VFG42_05795 [Baekduia sp.]|uniref:hypothetical protein n=1 Tax=Baekduia sp. TaxID=2600305 RepID=UPI002D7775EB|nr:hypothetical protein [Baekduia sp.]HET6506280.1 hypothetical protein [Baekduia sp.]
MQIALVAVVLLAGMWFTVLKPKPADDHASYTPVTPAPAATASSSTKVAPGVKGLTKAVDKAKAASATSDATNAKIQSATGNAPTPAKAKATKSVAATKKAAAPIKAKAKAVAPAKARAKTTAATAADDKVDPSDRLLAFLAKGKTLVVLFEGKGTDDQEARRAVHLTAKADPKHVVSAYIPIGKVGDYEKITTDVQIYGSPTVLVIGADRKATALTGFVDAPSIQQAVGDARREAASSAKK